MNPRSEYAVDTRRMIATGKVRQGIREWPQNANYPNKELLGRYDLYPQPSGKEQQSATRLREEAPPTGPPDGQILHPQNGALGVRLNRKTYPSGAASPKASTQTNKNKQKIRDLRLRWQQTGSLMKPQPIKAKPAAATRSEFIPLLQAIRE